MLNRNKKPYDTQTHSPNVAKLKRKKKQMNYLRNDFGAT